MGTFLPLLAQEAEKLSWDRMPDLPRLLPGAFLCLWLVVILIADLVRAKGPGPLYPQLSLAGIAVTLGLVLFGSHAETVTGYGGFPSLAPDSIARIFKVVFLLTAGITVLFAMRSRERWANEAEFHVILLGSLAGMFYLASATEMVGFYLAFETVSYTGFLMAGYRADDAKSAEAGGKFVMFGAVASAVMLFGLSLVYGFTGSMEFSVIAEKLAQTDAQPALILAAVFVFAGFAFKAAAFPMQWWCPDVYEGSPAPVAAFLAVASKAAVFSAIVRILMLGGNTAAQPALTEFFAKNAGAVQITIVLAAAATMTWGNFAALRQQNLQRMLAYSSIAHAGYLLMTAAVILPAAGAGDAQTAIRQDAVSAILFYFLVYLVMNLGAFWVVTMMRRDAGSADVSALRGLGRSNPWLAICFAVTLFSLTGLPPTAGFIGKLQLFAPVVRHGFYLLAAVGLLNGAVSLYYYAKPVREMFLVQVAEGSESKVVARGFDLALAVALAVPLVVFGLFGWGGVTEMTLQAVARIP